MRESDEQRGAVYLMGKTIRLFAANQRMEPSN
jgi:hypothetical protein